MDEIQRAKRLTQEILARAASIKSHMSQVSQSMANMQQIQDAKAAQVKQQKEVPLGLLDLPRDLLSLVATSVEDPQGLACLTCTCKALADLVYNDEQIWQELCRRDWHITGSFPWQVPLLGLAQGPINNSSATAANNPLAIKSYSRRTTQGSGAAAAAAAGSTGSVGLKAVAAVAALKTAAAAAGRSAIVSKAPASPTSPSAKAANAAGPSLAQPVIDSVNPPTEVTAEVTATSPRAAGCSSESAPVGGSSSSSSSSPWALPSSATGATARLWRSLLKDRTQGWRLARHVLQWLANHGSPATVSGSLHRQQLLAALKYLELLLACPAERARRKAVLDEEGIRSLLALLANDAGTVQELSLSILASLVRWDESLQSLDPAGGSHSSTSQVANASATSTGAQGSAQGDRGPQGRATVTRGASGQTVGSTGPSAAVAARGSGVRPGGSLAGHSSPSAGGQSSSMLYPRVSSSPLRGRGAACAAGSAAPSSPQHAAAITPGAGANCTSGAARKLSVKPGTGKPAFGAVACWSSVPVRDLVLAGSRMGKLMADRLSGDLKHPGVACQAARVLVNLWAEGCVPPVDWPPVDAAPCTAAATFLMQAPPSSSLSPSSSHCNGLRSPSTRSASGAHAASSNTVQVPGETPGSGGSFSPGRKLLPGCAPVNSHLQRPLSAAAGGINSSSASCAAAFDAVLSHLSSGVWLLQEYSLRGESIALLHVLLAFEHGSCSLRGIGYELMSDVWEEFRLEGHMHMGSSSATNGAGGAGGPPVWLFTRTLSHVEYCVNYKGYSDCHGCWGTYTSGRDSSPHVPVTGGLLTHAPRVFRLFRPKEVCNLPPPLASAISRRRRAWQASSAGESSLHHQPQQSASHRQLSLAIPTGPGSPSGGVGSLMYGPLSTLGSSSSIPRSPAALAAASRHSAGPRAGCVSSPAAVAAEAESSHLTQSRGWDFPVSPSDMEALGPDVLGDPGVSGMDEEDASVLHTLMHEYENSDALAAIVAAMVLDDGHN